VITGEGSTVSFYGDPDELERLARRVRGQALEVRERAVRARAAAHAARWHSVARERFIAEVEDRVRRVEGAADLLGQAADRVDEQAAAVREVLAGIRAAQGAVLGWVAEAKAAAEYAVAGGVPELPPPGDRRWLEVADALRRRGVTL
jgi:hypothetical protein